MQGTNIESRPFYESTLAGESHHLDRQLEETLRFEKLIAALSVRFINLPANKVDGSIEDAQRLFCNTFGLDRSALFQHFTNDFGALVLTHLYDYRGNSSYGGQVEKRPDTKLHSDVYWARPEGSGEEKCAPVDVKKLWPWSFRQLERSQPVILATLDDLPPEAAQDRIRFQQYETKSTVIMPLQSGGKQLGCLSFATLRVRRTWTELEIKRFRFVADIFSNALARKRAEEELKENEERWRMAAEAAGFGAYAYDFTTQQGSYSAEYLALYGLSRKDKLELDTDGVPSAVLPEDKSAFAAGVKAALDPGKRGLLELEFRIRRQDTGNVRWLLVRGRTSFSGSGPDAQPVRSHGIAQDITEKKLSEEALTKSYAEIKLLKDQLQAETDYLKAEIKVQNAHMEIIGRSQGIDRVLHQVEQVASAECTVLITGETGTGKELIAQEIHRLSRRKDKVMVLVNCAALPSALVESELFGRERGAYTGALTSQIGRFEIANGSTIFLDEVGELSMEVQAKLLRVLQQGEFQRLGSPKTHKVDVRVIAATNRDLGEEVRKNRFREDLFYRLKVFPIDVPPLRQRAEDIPLLAFAFLEEFSTRMGKKLTKVPRKTMELLQKHTWPGNIRELRNVIEHSVILSGGDTLKVSSIGESPVREQPVTLAEAEREHIVRTLESTGWRIKGPHGAARRLDLQPSTLYSRMQKLGIPHRRQKDTMAVEEGKL